MRVFIHQKVTQRLLKYKGSKRVATGGILLGQVRKGDVYILQITEPSRWDIRRLFGHVRGTWKANRIIEREFNRSQGRTIYLGEWMTIPDDQPFPSAQHEKLIRHQFLVNDINEDYLLLLTVRNGEILCAKYSDTGIEVGETTDTSIRMQGFDFTQPAYAN